MTLKSSLNYLGKKVFTFVILGACTYSANSQEFWSNSQEPQRYNTEKRYIIPQEYRNVKIDRNLLVSVLANAPMHTSEPITNSSLIVEFPMPDGTSQHFVVVEDPVMSPLLSRKFPNIKTYSGQGLDDRTATIKIDVNKDNVHAIILSANRAVFIDPYTLDSKNDYISYYKKDYINKTKIFTELPPLGSNSLKEINHNDDHNDHVELVTSGSELRTYRLAIAATEEYSDFHGSDLEDVMAAIVTSINRVTGIYEKEVAVSFELVDNNDQIIFLDGDDLDNSDPGVLIDQSQETIDQIIGFDNYDIGHTFSTGAGGLAALGVPCTIAKAKGVTGTINPVGDPYDVDYVAHEIGHQFGARHTFNGNLGACNGNWEATTSFEPGSGTTIMGYAGICSNHNIQNHSDPFFHTGSFNQITDCVVNGNGSFCPTITETNNTPPVVNVPQTVYHIPVLTPFRLEGNAVDADGDQLTYSWEQVNTGPSGHPNTPAGNAPIFRSFPPVESSKRIFPRMEDVLSGTQTKGEKLIDYRRTLKFRLTARDNRAGGGGVSSAEYEVEVYNGSEPFEILIPHTGAGWAKGSTQTVTWEASNTQLAPVNCQNVNILLSLDGGENFDIILAENVPNIGAADISVPNVENTSNARLMVEAADNIFFDVSDGNFQINDTGLGVEEIFQLNSVTLFPNPVSNSLSLTVELSKQHSAEITILDAIGKVVLFSKENELSGGSNNIDLNITSLNSGIYFLRINIEGQHITKRFSKL